MMYYFIMININFSKWILLLRKILLKSKSIILLLELFVKIKFFLSKEIKLERYKLIS